MPQTQTQTQTTADAPPPLTIQIQPSMTPRTVFVRMKDLPGTAAVELDGLALVQDLIVRFHEHAFAKSYAAFAARASLLMRRDALETPVRALDELEDLDVLVYKPCDELRVLVEQGCITPVLGARSAARGSMPPALSPASSPSGLKRKGRAASVTNNVERVHRYASDLAKMDVSPREKELIEDMLIVGDEKVVDAMEQFVMHRNTATLRRALRGPSGAVRSSGDKKSMANAPPTPTLENLSVNFSSLDVQSPVVPAAGADQANPFLMGGENPFVRAAATTSSFHDVTSISDHRFQPPMMFDTDSSPFMSGNFSAAPMMMMPVEHAQETRSSASGGGRPSLMLDDGNDDALSSAFLPAIQESSTSRLSLSLEQLSATFDESSPQLFSIAALLDNVPVQRDFLAKYAVGEVLGSGKSSVVKACTSNATGEKFAVKIIDKRQMLEVRFLKRELEIMFSLRHDGIVRLVELFESQDELFLVMELCGQELFAYIDRQGPLRENVAQKLIRRLVSTVAYLHDECIVHRDIKPENILIHSDDVSDIKLSDFGIARRLEGGDCTLTPHESLSEVANLHDQSNSTGGSSGASGGVRNRLARAHTKCGTRDYVAPEVMSGKGYGTEADLWSVGVVTFVLLSGCAPVFLPDTDGSKKVFFSESDGWAGVSDDAKRFIETLLVRNPEARSTAAEALEHPWLKAVTQ